MSVDGQSLAARVKQTRTPSVEEKYDALQNKFIDLIGERNLHRHRAFQFELTVRDVHSLVRVWQQNAREGVPDPSWRAAIADVLAALVDHA